MILRYHSKDVPKGRQTGCAPPPWQLWSPCRPAACGGPITALAPWATGPRDDGSPLRPKSRF